MNHELLQIMNYEQIFSPKVVEKIQELSDTDVSVEECLEFIDRFGEQDFLEYYESYVDFESDFKFVNIQTLIDFYSGLSFLDLEFHGEFPSQKHFIEMYYNIYLSSVISVDWDQTILNVSKFFDFIPYKDGFYIFNK